MPVNPYHNFFSSICSWFLRSLCLVLFVALQVGEANAQSTSTPTGEPSFSTGTPAPTRTPGGLVGGGSAYFDFKAAQAGFAAVTGSWVSGQGFTSSAGDIAVLGGYYMTGITRVTYYYSSTTGGTGDFELQDGEGGDPLYGSSFGFSSCPGMCSFFFSPSSVDSSLFVLAVDVGAGDFKLQALKVDHDGISEDYSTDENGCPVLSPDQKAKLDPLYFAQCTRCFVDATPVRDNQIPTQVVAVPTTDLTATSPYSIPVIVSGTPMTATPIVGGAAPTFPPPTATGGTALPPDVSCMQNGDGGGVGDWLPISFHTTIPTAGTYNSGVDRWEGAYSADATGKLLRIRQSWDGSMITSIRVHISYSSTLSTSVNALICGIWADAPLGDLSLGDELDVTYSNVHPATDSGYMCQYDNPSGLMGVTALDIASSAFSNGSDGYSYIDSVEICGDVDILPTATPSPTATGAPWMPTPDLGESDCSVAVFRDDTPAVTIPEHIAVHSYGCYTLIPDITIEIPGRGDVGLDGVELCVTWFVMPVITVLGITISIDWLLFPLVAWLIARLLGF